MIRFRLRTAFLIMTAIAAALFAYRLLPIDRITEELFYPGYSNTTWASGYSEDGFQTIRSGMKRKEVYAIIGPPLATEPPIETNHSVELWTARSNGGPYQIRAIGYEHDVVIFTVARTADD
jgi:hypothetical protein